MAKLYICSMSSAIAAADDNGRVKLSDRVREEIMHWRFLDMWPGFLPWRSEKHVRVSMFTDAADSGWGGVYHTTSGDTVLSEYWKPDELGLNISTKEMLVICYAIQGCKDIRDCRVDVLVESQVAIDAFRGEGR